MAFPNASTFAPFPDLHHGFEYAKDFHQPKPLSNIFRMAHVTGGYRYDNVHTFNHDNGTGVIVLGDQYPATKAPHNALVFPEVKPVHIMQAPVQEPSIIDKIRELVK